MNQIPYDTFVFVFGLIIGSFLNVCIYRIPRGESVVMPPSHCPNCGKRIRWYDNIPIISYLILRGKCRFCGQPISIQYPIIELLTGILTLGIFLRFGISFDTIYYLILTYVLVVISVIDLKSMLVPVKPCYFAMVLGIILSPFTSSITFKSSMLGASFGAGVILFIIETYYIIAGKKGMGYGDANIMALVGAFLGWQKVFLTLFLASLMGATVGIFLIANGKSRKTPIPFGPYISLAAYITVLFGNNIISWYLR